MTIEEFSDQFDVLYNNITSNQAPGLTEYEKSLFLTKAEKEIVKNYFTANSKGNNIGQGFDDSAKRQADFSILMKTAECTPVTMSESGSITTVEYVCTQTGNPPVSLTINDITITKDGVNYVPDTGSYPVRYGTELNLGSGNTATINGFPYYSGTLNVIRHSATTASAKIDPRSFVYTFPNDVFIVINETITASSKYTATQTIAPFTRYLQIIPLRYDEYTRLMSKPFKRPLKYQAWRLINTGVITGDVDYTNDPDSGQAQKYVEIITNLNDEIDKYYIRYVRTPKPIIVGDLDGLTIDGYSLRSPMCEIDPILHEDILQRAVELAKIAWTASGNDNAQAVIQGGQRSE